MNKLNEYLDSIEKNRGCLIANEHAHVVSCHEYTEPRLCDCEILRLTAAIRMYDLTLSEIENYLNFMADDLVGDDLVGDKKKTKRYNAILLKIREAKNRLIG